MLIIFQVPAKYIYTSRSAAFFFVPQNTNHLEASKINRSNVSFFTDFHSILRVEIFDTENK